MRRRMLVGLVAGVFVAVIAVVTAYLLDMRRANDRIRGKSRVVASPYGDIEYTEGGAGPAVLVVHGSGGGFDQGELLVQALLGDEFHWITPSRFGYLRSTHHDGATFDDQADAYAFLLRHLGVEQAAVVALSHGGPSALLFAVRHPGHVSSLTLISAGVASSADAAQAQANRKGDALMRIFQHDSWYWALTKAFRGRFLALMGAPDGVIATLTPGQRALIDQVIDGMNPVSLRAAGAAFDNTAAMPNERIAAVRAPTLVIHARDDTLQRYHNAQFAAATIPGARLAAFERGGHLLLALEQPAIRTLLRQHVREHAGRVIAGRPERWPGVVPD